MPGPTKEQIKAWEDSREPLCILCHKKGSSRRVEVGDPLTIKGSTKVTITTCDDNHATILMANLPVKMVLCLECEKAINEGKVRGLMASKYGVIEEI